MLLLDVMLPERDGFALCREIRKNSDVPIIFITTDYAHLPQGRTMAYTHTGENRITADRDLLDRCLKKPAGQCREIFSACL